MVKVLYIPVADRAHSRSLEHFLHTIAGLAFKCHDLAIDIDDVEKVVAEADKTIKVTDKTQTI